MSNNQSLSLIESLIQKTKSNYITWSKYSNSHYDIKPLPSSSLERSPESVMLAATESLIPSASFTSLDSDNSYVASSGDGVFFLLLYTSVLHGNKIDLRVQTKHSQSSKIYASTEDKNIKISAQLKRLYNIVDFSNSTEDIDAFVDNFVKNE